MNSDKPFSLKRKIGLFALLMLLGTLCAPETVLAQGQYCAQRTNVSPGSQCFGTQAQAEAWLRAEYSPVTGSKFLVPLSVTPISMGTFSIGYAVKLKKFERFFGDWYTGQTILNDGGGGSHCNFNPIPISVGMYGCEDETSLAADVLDSWPHGGPGWTGRYIGSYRSMPPDTWYLGGHSQERNRDYIAVPMSHPAPDDRRFISTLDGADIFQTIIYGTNYYECPNLFVGKEPGVANSKWPTVCYNGSWGNIAIYGSKQYNSCAKDGNPCVAATATKNIANMISIGKANRLRELITQYATCPFYLVLGITGRTVFPID